MAAGFRGLPLGPPYGWASSAAAPPAAGGFRGLPGIVGLAWRSFGAAAAAVAPPSHSGSGFRPGAWELYRQHQVNDDEEIALLLMASVTLPRGRVA